MDYPFLFGGVSGYRGTTMASVVLDGDSRQVVDEGSIPQWWQLLEQNQYKGTSNVIFTEHATGGQRIDQCTTDVVTTVGAVAHDTLLPYGRRVLVMWAGVNDMRTAAETPATAFSDMKTYLQTIAAKKIYHEIIIILQIPSSTSGGHPVNADLVTWNNLVKDHWGDTTTDDLKTYGATQYIDLAALYPAVFGDFTDFTGSFTGTVYYRDTLHLTVAGRRLVAQAVYDKLESIQLTKLPFRAEGVVGWLTYNHGVTLANGSYVSTWRDQLCNRFWLQATEVAQPTLDTTNKLVDFDDDSLYLQNTYTGRDIFQNVAGMGFSVNLSSDLVVTGADDDWVFQFSTGTSSSAYRLGLRLQNDVIQMRIRAADTDTGTAAQGGSYTAGERMNVTGYTDVNDIATTGAYIHKNGTLLQKITTGYTGGSGVKTSNTASSRANLGAVGTSVYFQGKISEIIFFDARHESYISGTEAYMLARPWLSAG